MRRRGVFGTELTCDVHAPLGGANYISDSASIHL
jgi:hypothetical protein